MICYALVFGVVLGFVLLAIWAREVIVFQITANNNQKKINNNLYQPKIS